MINQIQLGLFLTTVRRLLNVGSTTTLDIKNELRKKHPYSKWTQAEISELMQRTFNEDLINGLVFDDNGVHRTYYLNSIVQPFKSSPIPFPSINYISRSKMVKKMRKSKGKFFTVSFIKNDGNKRTINGQIKKDNFMNDMGYINITESNGNIRQVNPRTVYELKIDNTTYVSKTS